VGVAPEQELALLAKPVSCVQGRAAHPEKGNKENLVHLTQILAPSSFAWAGPASVQVEPCCEESYTAV
jgi:hypothetical protein